jgi:hypothetical protein
MTVSLGSPSVEWGIALVSAPFLSNPSLPVASSDALRELHYLNLVAYPDRAGFDHPRADSTTTL